MDFYLNSGLPPLATWTFATANSAATFDPPLWTIDEITAEYRNSFPGCLTRFFESALDPAHQELSIVLAGVRRRAPILIADVCSSLVADGGPAGFI